MTTDSVRDNKEQAFNAAMETAKEIDPSGQAKKGEFKFTGNPQKGEIVIPSFNSKIKVSWPSMEMSLPEDLDSFALKVLALRYIAMSDGTPVSMEWVPYRDLPGGSFYAATLVPTVEEPLASVFGKKEGTIVKAAEALGGRRAFYGNEAYVFHMFPRIPILLIVYLGDDEFGPNATLLYDKCCTNYLNTDDMKVASSLLVSMLFKKHESFGGDVGGYLDSMESQLWMVD